MKSCADEGDGAESVRLRAAIDPILPRPCIDRLRDEVEHLAPDSMGRHAVPSNPARFESRVIIMRERRNPGSTVKVRYLPKNPTTVWIEDEAEAAAGRTLFISLALPIG
ncbi:hypothetical protein ABT061_32715 [Streptosporangium sp. NPDC002544]|uniref:hypothetical protein n=1 Tax=Streptosporangium sp. NPDC002544 TaxID=3154538 RepID=UPI00331CE47D